VKLVVAAGFTDDFLTSLLNTWNRNDNYMYINTQKVFHNLKVVNDAAECSVGLIQSFSAILSNQEKQKPLLIQIVEKHCQNF